MPAWNLQAYFDAPAGNEPLALDLRSMGKGQVWINGQSIGRYWMAYAKGDCKTCSYAGTFRPINCQRRCGHPTQRWYYLKTNEYCTYIWIDVLDEPCSNKVLDLAGIMFQGPG